MTVSLLVMTAIQILPKYSHLPEIFWPWYALIGTTVMIGVSWLVRTLMTAVAPMPKN